MANFAKAFHFERFVPHLGDNKQLPPAEQLVIEVATGISKVDLAVFARGWQDVFGAGDSKPVEGETAEAATAREALHLDNQAASLAERWGQFFKLERGGHSIDGLPVNNLREYLRALLDQTGGYNLLELSREMYRHNSVDGTKELFFNARSGGSAGTAARSAPPKAAH